jgi:hypothetical protein
MIVTLRKVTIRGGTGKLWLLSADKNENSQKDLQPFNIVKFYSRRLFSLKRAFE